MTDARDIVIVGAGIVGCAVAYELARRGASVEVVDMREAGQGATQASAGMHDLIDAACEVVPHGWTAGFLGARVGLRPASTDGLPIIGASRVVPNLMYATAHHRNGILLAPVTAVLVADAMLDNRVDALLGPVSPFRFGNL